MEDTPGPVVSIERVTAGYRSKGRRSIVLRDLDLGIRPGEVVGLVGRNGVGKSTLLRLLPGFLDPWHGRIRVDGTTPRRFRRLNGVAYVPESVALPGHWDLETFLRCGAQLAGLPPSTWAAAVERACSEVGLDTARSVALASQSRGQARRAVLAFALLGEPRFALFDEPWVHLDADGRALVRERIRLLRARGATVVVSSHELDEIARVADVVHVIGPGGRKRTMDVSGLGRQEIEPAFLPEGAS